jgi:hypothetical protein
MVTGIQHAPAAQLLEQPSPGTGSMVALKDLKMTEL